MENLEKIWLEAESHLEETLPETKKQWIRRIAYAGEENGVIILALSSAFYKDTAEKNCRTDIENMVSEIAGKETNIKFIVDESRKTAVKTPARKEVKPKEEKHKSQNTTLNKQ